MRLTLMSDYALRLLLHVAENPDRLCTIQEVADRHQISHSHLTKVVHRLGQCGWLHTLRGKHGGITLAQAPKEIRIGAVVRRMEPDFELVECLGSQGQCILASDCRLQGILVQALTRFLEELDGYTLADLLRQPTDAIVAWVRPMD